MAVAKVNGIEIAYEVHGEGEPLVLVCGTGQRADSWSFLGMVTEPVEQGYQVVTFDNRGMAPSGSSNIWACPGSGSPGSPSVASSPSRWPAAGPTSSAPPSASPVWWAARA